MIFFFISNSMSPYYRSETFQSVLEKLGQHQMFEVKQVENRLKLIVRKVTSMEKAYKTLKMLQ